MATAATTSVTPGSAGMVRRAWGHPTAQAASKSLDARKSMVVWLTSQATAPLDAGLSIDGAHDSTWLASFTWCDLRRNGASCDHISSRKRLKRLWRNRFLWPELVGWVWWRWWRFWPFL